MDSMHRALHFKRLSLEALRTNISFLYQPTNQLLLLLLEHEQEPGTISHQTHPHGNHFHTDERRFRSYKDATEVL